ncbi:MAG: hypothetical protein WA584_15945 [Pyrinomonadaceae bacterium]
MNKIFVFIIAALAFALGGIACSVNRTTQAEQPKANDSKAENNAVQAKANEPAKSESTEATPAKTVAPKDKSACLKARLDRKKLIADQTFVFDYEPFPKSCFVTFGNLDEMMDDKDLPRGSTFYIYRDGEQIYEFADAFDGQTGCWVEGVGFEDLNDDGKTEVIVAGRCLGAKDSYTSNAVYINSGDDFQTSAEQNRLIENFKTIKEISAFVKKNKSKFF